MPEAPNYGDENSQLMEELAETAPYARRYKGEFE
jgi:hypothetical protein